MRNTFITHQKALDILEIYKSELLSHEAPLENCTDAYLAEDLVADCDFPPFDRVTMDGIAIAYIAFEKGRKIFEIETVAPAGQPQKILNDDQNCIEVMTGTILPKHTDTVVRYEDLNIVDSKATINLKTVQQAQNIHFRGMDITKGTIIVEQGKQISSAEINIAAAIGKRSLLIKQLPPCVIVSTGEELVDIDEKPDFHQIRRSNVYGIKNTLKQWGMTATLRHLNDDKMEMYEAIKKLLNEYDLLIFTGGVSKGKFDYLPEVLKALNITKHFYKVQQRPGKPFWFGTEANKKIFAFPGNPVSSFVCLYAYFQYWLKKSLNLPILQLYVILLEDVNFMPELIYFLEAQLMSKPDGKLYARPIIGNGSGDFVNLVHTDGFLILPQNKTKFKKGEVYPFISYRYKI